MTQDDSLANAARLLQAAEVELDLTKMERLTQLADCWIAIAAQCMERERV